MFLAFSVDFDVFSRRDKLPPFLRPDAVAVLFTMSRKLETSLPVAF
jgi:hypothetical protein